MSDNGKSPPPDGMIQWNKGQHLQNGKYEIVDILGGGGFGVTYRAREVATNRMVAIKTLNAVVQNKPNFADYQEKFVKEAFCLARCSHPHVVQVFDVFQEDGLWCMVMEYVAGMNLAEYIQDNGWLTEAEALRYIRQVGEALTFVHQQGFLHRDVKPLNIMLRETTREAVLIDFGLAREFTIGKTQTHTNAITEGYAPIEQYNLRDKRGEFTDVHALAATLYNLLTNEMIPPAKFRKDFNIPLPPPTQYNSSISQRVSDAILKGMALEPQNRPQTVMEWLALLMDLGTQKQGFSLELKSAVGMDYGKLQQLLAAQEWRKADEETRRVMLKVANREKEGWLDKESIDNFPCEDLRTIDRLWVHYSNGHFGFSVQKRIWQQLGGKIDYDTEGLGDAVGWRKDGKWLNYNDLTFSLASPTGHFPVACLGGGVVVWFFSRVETCEV